MRAGCVDVRRRVQVVRRQVESSQSLRVARRAAPIRRRLDQLLEQAVRRVVLVRARPGRIPNALRSAVPALSSACFVLLFDLLLCVICCFSFFGVGFVRN